MKTTLLFGIFATAAAVLIIGATQSSRQLATAQEGAGAQDAAEPDPAALERSRKTVQTLDNIFKQTIVLITDKYVHDQNDFAAGSAAVLLFETISEGGDNKIRLIDATGDPYDPDNVARDEFEKRGIKKLKGGAETVDEVVTEDGKPFLRALTPVPVVMDKCVMCHAHYEDAKPGEPIGAISYTVPIE